MTQSGRRLRELFGGTDIGRDPTPNRSRYVVLRFNFSAFNDAVETLEREFEEYCVMQMLDALERSPDLFPGPALERIRSPSSVNGRLSALFLHAGRHDIPLYVLIDEYERIDTGHRGPDAYHASPTAAASFAISPRQQAGTENAAWAAFVTALAHSPWTT